MSPSSTISCFDEKPHVSMVNQFPADASASQEEQEAFYQQLYSGFPNVDELQALLVGRQECFAKDAALAVMKEQLGLS